MKKNKLIDFLIFVFSYLLCASFPWGLFIHGSISEWLIPVLEILMQVIFLLFWFFFIKRTSLNLCKIRFNMKNYLIMVPLFFIFLSNYCYGILKPSDFSPSLDYTFAFKVALTFLVVTNEEYLFRYILLGNLDLIKKPIHKVLIDSLIFALCHLSSFFSTFDPQNLIVVVYSFGLGCVLGLFYVFGGAPSTCILLHLLFNLLNGVVFDTIYVVSDYSLYIVSNIVFSLLFAIYVLIIYCVQLRKHVVYNIRDEII